MTQHRLRITAAALALAAALGLAVPAHAAGRTGRSPGIGWIEDVVQWVARVWVGNEKDPGLKYGIGIDPNGNPAPTPPSGAGAGTDGATAQAADPSDSGVEIDPNG